MISKTVVYDALHSEKQGEPSTPIIQTEIRFFGVLIFKERISYPKNSDYQRFYSF